MSEEGFKRKLTAILSADVEGYGRLMDDDEEATVRTLKAYRKAMADLIQQFRGRIVDTPGDNLLSEFTSVVDAVNCAVEIQRELAERNTEVPYNRKMNFRIGINLGDVIDEEGRIYGDGINIAARVEAMADAGGICISGRAYDQVANKLGLEYENLGEHQVKNISTPIRVYRVLSFPGAAAHRVTQAKERLGQRWRRIALSTAAVVVVAAVVLGVWQYYVRRSSVEPASVEKMAYPLPENPSIAVLAFDNMSGDPEQEYFSDGITEEIITALSQIPDLFVIARNSTFTYKGTPVKIKQVAEEFGVRYVLEGSVRKSEDRVRITAQLIDALTGRHLWSERYDRDLKDIFALQDEITMKIIRALEVKLFQGDQYRLTPTKAPNLDVYLKMMQTRALLRKGTRESLIRYGQLSQEIIDMAPEYAGGYRTLAWDNWMKMVQGISPRESLNNAFKLTQKAIALDETAFFYDHLLLGQLYLSMREYEKAVAEGKRAIGLAPNAADAHLHYGRILSLAGKPDEGVIHLKQAIRLNPFPPNIYYSWLGGGYMQKGQYEEALAAIKKSLQMAPDNWYSYFNLAIVYSLLDRQEEARAAANKLHELYPDFSAERVLKLGPMKNQAYLKLLLEASHKAGLK